MTQFRIEIPEADLRDLRERLARTRWPESETVEDWSQGVPLVYLKDLCGYWGERYDWRATESRLNALPHFRTMIDGLGIHFLHVRSPHAEALPLVITHGWPGSLVEVQHIAAAWTALMARLGYERYGAQGSDWGTSISASVGQQDPGHVAGIHLSPPLAPPDPATFDDLTERERAALASMKRSAERDSGYSQEQSTRPQTIGYALVDSPAALCAWIIEKFWAWTDCDGHPENVLTRDELLDNVMLYWLPGTGASSARLYWESSRQVNEWISGPTGDTVAVPTGCSIFPKEIQRPSRRWAEKRFLDIRYWNEPDRGGHFAAFEQPDLFVEELRAFFRLVR